ncbi:MAG: hypothetical protein OCD00_05335 [Colwellia sp.]
MVKVATFLLSSFFIVNCFMCCALADSKVKIDHKIKITKSHCQQALLSKYVSTSTSTPASTETFELHNLIENISFWNHIATYPDDYSSIKLSKENYKLQRLSDASCYQSSVLAMTLVKKISDWDRQHGNGIEFSFAQKKLTFAHFEFFKIRMKLKVESSYLPNKKLAQAALSPLMTDEISAELDDSNAYIKFSFYGDDHANNKVSTFYGETIVSIDPTVYGNTWIDISIPLNDLSYFSQKNYQEQAVTLAQIKHELVNGLLIVAETKNGKTLRHYYVDEYPKHAPEVLKEISIEIDQILLTH